MNKDKTKQRDGYGYGGFQNFEERPFIKHDVKLRDGYVSHAMVSIKKEKER